METQKLHKIADIRFGVLYPAGAKGEVHYLQVGDISESGHISVRQPVFVGGEVSPADFLKPGDVLLPAKGSKLLAAAVSAAFGNNKAAASPSLFVIRVTNESVLPEYVQWFLNQPRSQWNLKKGAGGTNISSLSIKYIRNFKIKIPDLAVQKKLIALKRLQEREADILEQLRAGRDKLILAAAKTILN